MQFFYVLWHVIHLIKLSFLIIENIINLLIAFDSFLDSSKIKFELFLEKSYDFHNYITFIFLDFFLFKTFTEKI